MEGSSEKSWRFCICTSSWLHACASENFSLQCKRESSPYNVGEPHRIEHQLSLRHMLVCLPPAQVALCCANSQNKKGGPRVEIDTPHYLQAHRVGEIW